ncbi:putative Integral membrane protein (putative) [Streptococcus sp. DD10]|uniref:DUF1700 domain-containing protein n=1 Tax=Streptococcus sp. DD10 TaxID=1777878 RepID=UPI00079BEC9E|nr:DUF1700 domain-containing protein [Streptococcus sp. DD10]KXT74300.1 putative Integral membrane protein (putative) [Streptococcus sp. DD10]
MTRTEYLAQLERYLKKLPKEDYDEVMDYFVELFDEAGDLGEQELMEGLGRPKEAAHEIMSNLLDKKLSDETDSTSKRHLMLIIGLSILAAPVGVPLLLFPFMAMIGILVGVIVAILGIGAVTLTAFLFGATVVWDSFTLFTESLPAFLLIFGGGVIALGISCLMFLAIFYVVRFGASLLIHVGKFFVNKLKRGA